MSCPSAAFCVAADCARRQLPVQCHRHAAQLSRRGESVGVLIFHNDPAFACRGTTRAHVDRQRVLRAVCGIRALERRCDPPAPEEGDRAGIGASAGQGVDLARRRALGRHLLPTWACRVSRVRAGHPEGARGRCSKDPASPRALPRPLRPARTRRRARLTQAALRG